MPTIETTLHASYQGNTWKVKDAIREILSNAIDGETRGLSDGTGKMIFEYDAPRTMLRVINRKTTVPTKALLMGTSESREHGDCIGTFGEGLPMALLVLARQGYPVVIYNGDEKWVPEIILSERFQSKVLAIHTRQLIKAREDFVVEIGHLEPDDMEEVQRLFLRLDPAFASDQTFRGSAYNQQRVLMQPEFKGRLYVKGVFIAKMDDLMFGYDLDMQLNRDRSFVNTYELRNRIGSLLSDVFQSHRSSFGEILIERIMTGAVTQETLDAYADLGYDNDFCSAIMARWDDRFGPDTLAADTVELAQEAADNGLDAVVVPPFLATVVSKSKGSIRSHLTQNAKSVVRWYEDTELIESERDVLHWLRRSLSRASKESVDLRAVEFKSNDTRANNEASVIQLSRVTLQDRAVAVRHAAKELAHIRSRRGLTTSIPDDQIHTLSLIAAQGE